MWCDRSWEALFYTTALSLGSTGGWFPPRHTPRRYSNDSYRQTGVRMVPLPTPQIHEHFFSFFLFFIFLGLQLQHMEVPRLGVNLELQLLAYATAIATQDPSHVWDLHHSSGHCWILNPLSKARDHTWNLMVTSRIHFCCTTMETPL